MEETIRILKEHNIFQKDYCYLVMWLKTRNNYSVKQVSEALNVSERVAGNYVERLECAGLLELGARVDRKVRQKMSDIEAPDKSAALSLRFAHYCWRTLLNIYPDNLEIKKAYVDVWEKHARLLINERGVREATDTFKFAMSDDFWQKAILSVSSLRKNFDKIKVKSKSAQPQLQTATTYLSDD